MLIPEFPTQTHIFFWREIVALRKIGVTVDVLSTRKPKEDCPHEFGRVAARETHYVYPPDLKRAPSALAGRGLARVAAYVASLSPGSRAKALGLVVCAADLSALARRRGIDHVHVHSCADSSHVAAMSHLLSGLSFSVHVHGDLAVYGVDHAQKLSNAAFVAVAARPHMDQVVDRGIPRSRVHRMVMGVDVSRSEPRVYDGAGGPLHLASVSRLALCKGHRYALEAIARLRDGGVDVRYSIAGQGPDQPAIEADVARLGLRDRVTLVGPLSEDGVRALLKTTDLFLLTSVGLGEASPVAVMEAAACGVPSVCSRIGGTADMIETGVDGALVDQEDVAGIAAAIRELDGDRERLRRMGAAARRRAEREFDATVLARNFVSAVQASRAASGGDRPELRAVLGLGQPTSSRRSD
jgi:glycosyltransferase involved in cell wall biosynthesis